MRNLAEKIVRIFQDFLYQPLLRLFSGVSAGLASAMPCLRSWIEWQALGVNRLLPMIGRRLVFAPLPAAPVFEFAGASGQSGMSPEFNMFPDE